MSDRVAKLLEQIKELTAVELAELLNHLQEPPPDIGVREPVPTGGK